MTPPSPSSDLYGESNPWIANVGSLERDDFENKKRSRNNYEQIVGRCKKVMNNCKQHVSFLSCIVIRPRKIMSDQEICGDAAESPKNCNRTPRFFSVFCGWTYNFCIFQKKKNPATFLDEIFCMFKTVFLVLFICLQLHVVLSCLLHSSLFVWCLSDSTLSNFSCVAH